MIIVLEPGQNPKTVKAFGNLRPDQWDCYEVGKLTVDEAKAAPQAPGPLFFDTDTREWSSEVK